MLFARINDADYPIISGSINWELDAVCDFSFSIVANLTDYTTLLYQPASIRYKNKELISGFIDKRPVIRINNSEVITVELSCVNNLGILANRRSYRNSHFQNNTLNAILNTLIGSISGWALDTTTLTTGTERITIDLRSKETLLAQFAEVISSSPSVHFRYGGIVGGNHILEVGDFNELTSHAYKGFNLLDITLQPQENRFYQVIEAYSGRTDTGGTNRIIRLNRALTDARYLASPYLAQFPITLDATDGAYIITNSLAPSGVTSSIRKSFSYIKTKNDVAPTAAELDDVSYMLYLKGVRYLKESIPANLYELRMTDKEIPIVGNRVFINARIQEPILNEQLNYIDEYVTMFNVLDDYRITRVSLNLEEIIASYFDNGFVIDEYIFSLTASENDELGFYDQELELYEKLEEKAQMEMN